MTSARALDDVSRAARDYESSEHRLRLAVTAARAAEVPIASIARAAGITRQTVYNWSTEYGRASQLTVSAGTSLDDLPIQRPRAVKKAPVLILSSRHRKGLPIWDGRRGRAAGYAGDQLGVSVLGKIVDVIAESWALAGDSSGDGRRPEIGDLVICPDGTLGTVAPGSGADGGIDVERAGAVSRVDWWAIVLPAVPEHGRGVAARARIDEAHGAEPRSAVPALDGWLAPFREGDGESSSHLRSHRQDPEVEA